MSFKDFRANVISLKQEDKTKREKALINKIDTKFSKRLARNDNCVGCKSHRNTIINSIVFMLVVSLAGTFILHYVLISLNHLQQRIDTDYMNSDIELILDTKAYLDATATAGLKDISHQITDNIYDSFNMEELEKDMSRGYIPSELNNIFKDAIIDKCTINGLDSESNNIFICNKEGILADFSNIYASDSETTRTWEVEASSQRNSRLYSNSIQGLVNQDTSFLFVEEKEESDVENHVYLARVSNQTIESLYRREGLEGLKNYTFLVPVYVLENNDIFGVDDIINGQRVHNNKFIIVQRYNLYDYLVTYNLDIRLAKDVDYEFTSIYNLIYIFIIVYIISILVFIFYSITVLNKAINDQEAEARTKDKILKSMMPKDNNESPLTGRRAYDRYSAEIIRLIQEERDREYEESQGATNDKIQE